MTLSDELAASSDDLEKLWDLGIFEYHLKGLPNDLDRVRDLRSVGENPRVQVYEFAQRRLQVWWDAYKGDMFEVPPADLYQYAVSLGSLLEIASFYVDAESVLEMLTHESFISRLSPAFAQSALITAGEYRRRRGSLDAAERHYIAALRMLQEGETGQEPHFHRQMGRLYYELAYLHRLRGDAGACRSAFEQSEVECVLANDMVGVEIARCSIASVSCEEGFPQPAVAQFTDSLRRLERMIDESSIKEAGRAGLARRWLGNVRSDLSRAYLASQEQRQARVLIEQQLAEDSVGPSVRGLLIIKRLEARLLLSEGRLDAAEAAINASFKAIGDGEIESTELAAATVMMIGLVEALLGSRESARQSFQRACSLPSDLNNRRAQGCAWAGLAIIARDANDIRSSRMAIRSGLELLGRCGAPIRNFLFGLMKDIQMTAHEIGFHALMNVVCRFGD
jgi:tetratricopeptide (TPR) repeat protein